MASGVTRTIGMGIGMGINWLGALVALIVGMAVSGVWYGKLFLALWWELTGITPEQSRAASRRNMGHLVVANAITAVGLAVAIDVTSTALEDDSVGPALLVGLVAWLAFSASTLIQHNAFELKRPRLTALNCAYQLVLFEAMALVIGLF